MMSSFSETLEDAFRRAFPVQDAEALRRSVRILEDAYDPYRRLETDLGVVKYQTEQLTRESTAARQDITELKSDVQLVAERMEQGFARMDERFEAMERLNAARFEAHDRRFEAVDRRLDRQTRLMFGAFTVLAVLMSIYEFIR